jgi:SpoVK/Ycf46/Vps4 family AAA+-type ATPase
MSKKKVTKKSSKKTARKSAKKTVKKKIPLKKQIKELGKEAKQKAAKRKKTKMPSIHPTTIKVLERKFKSAIIIVDESLKISTIKKKFDLVEAGGGILEKTDHQRRLIRNLLDLVKKGKYIALIIDKGNNFPNLGYLSEEMELLGAEKVHGSLTGSTMLWIGKKK